MIQASRPGRIQLLPTPDYGRFRRGEAQYDIDQDPVWQYQAKAQAFDAVAFYQCDHLGTPQELTDMNGEIAWAAEYKAWGYAYDALSKAGRQAGLKQPLRFQGQYYDHETGLHYNRHRYYDPHSGRFVSKDPIGLRGGVNLHRYAENPIKWIDPLGLIKWEAKVYTLAYGWGQTETYTLTSECKNGMRAIVKVQAVGAVYGEGFAGGVGSTATFYDSNTEIDPNVFNGVYSQGGGFVSLGIGYGWSSTQLGGAYARGGGITGGVGESVGSLAGKSLLIGKPRWETCTC
jgi:RHS repeat-associated protein